MERFRTGQTVVRGTGQTQVVPGGIVAQKGVQIKALKTNKECICVGISDTDIQNGFPLEAGDGIFIPVTNTEIIFAQAENDGDKLAWFAV